METKCRPVESCVRVVGVLGWRFQVCGVVIYTGPNEKPQLGISKRKTKNPPLVELSLLKVRGNFDKSGFGKMEEGT